MSKSDAEEKSHLISKRLISSDLVLNSLNIALYMPIKNEVDLSSLIPFLFENGKNIYLPVTDTISQTMYFSKLYEEQNFKNGSFGILEPANKIKADITLIDTLLIPGIAFSRKGDRIGWGKGYYDKALSHSDATKIGVCYDFQLVDEIFSDAHDCRMDYIISESELIKCE